MKKLILMAFAIAIASCSSDDSSGTKTKKYVQSTVLSDDDFSTEIVYTYNDEKQIVGMEVGDGDMFSLEYEDNKLTKILYPDESAFELIYTDGIWTKLDMAGTPYDVTYTEATSQYVVETLGEEYKLNSKGDPEVLKLGENSQTLAFDYEEGKKGPFYNVAGENTFFIGRPFNLFYGMTKGAISSFSIYTIENTYDEDGYVTKAVFMDGQDVEATIRYYYTEL